MTFNVCAVIPAAGCGLRTGLAIPKQVKNNQCNKSKLLKSLEMTSVNSQLNASCIQWKYERIATTRYY